MRWNVLRRFLLLVIASAGWQLATRTSHAEDSSFFEAKIRPLLVEHCLKCHGEKKQKGGLRLDSRAAWQKGGDSGAVIVPGDPEKSLVIKAVRWKDPDLRMPPDAKLTNSQLAALEQWIRSGAQDPRTEVRKVPTEKPWGEIFEERRKWWSLQPVKLPAIPPPTNPQWNSPVDRFLQHRMRQEKIAPAALATPEILIRRVTLVLTGLPPTPDEITAFVTAYRRDPEAAYSALVDRLMASPQFGERFARHWMDVVRFTETHGNEWNYDVPYAWRYRDYLIRAFNNNVPYDQLIREHLAGDLLTQPRWNAAGKYNESAIGTAFYRFGEVNHDSCVEFGVIGYDIVDNQLDTLTKAFQATTVACARCHDHKLDAVSSRDYYALLGILRSSRSVQRTLDKPEVNQEIITKLKTLKGEMRAALAEVWQDDLRSLDAAKLQALIGMKKEKALPESDPLQTWIAACKPGTNNVAELWERQAANHSKRLNERLEFNRTLANTVVDFRKGIPTGWTHEGMGLREGAGRSGDFEIGPEGENAIKRFLPAGLYTFALSEKLNGALRSPTLRRTHAKVSFEVIGAQHSLTRLVFNNCQLNYTHQQSLHHDDWSWVTIDFPKETDRLHPYAEVLTFWDNPKFPDPLGTLGKDTENQRGPFDEHARNPRTWWGVRRIVMHEGASIPGDEPTHLTRLYKGNAPRTVPEAAARYARICKEVVDAFAAYQATDDDVVWLEWMRKNNLIRTRANASTRLATLITRYRTLESQLTLPTVMPGVADEGEGFGQPILLRGDHTKPGEVVPRGYLQVLTPKNFVWSSKGSGRRELAELIANPENPLTARVMVNRIWLWVFGKGLVATPDDFGHLGDTPTHPELLDYLAERFIAEGWSVKKLVRTLVMSHAFRLDSAPTETAKRQDPHNRLLSHYPARRVEAEVIRDSILAVAGRLDARLFGPSIHPYRETADREKRLFTGPLDGEGRRSIYLKFQLMEAPHFLSAFNLPGGKVTQGRRDTTNTPAQSLALLNDPFVLAMADHWAGRVIRDGARSVEQRIDAMGYAALGRHLTPGERGRFLKAVQLFAQAHQVAQKDILSNRTIWKDVAHTLFNLKEFIFLP